jgi:hypothetical protein
MRADLPCEVSRRQMPMLMVFRQFASNGRLASSRIVKSRSANRNEQVPRAQGVETEQRYFGHFGYASS